MPALNTADMIPLTVKEYAKFARLHPETVREWCRVGKLRAKRTKGGGAWRIYEDPRKY